MTVLIDITPGRPVPPPDPRAARRRLRLGLIAAGAVASVLAGGAGYTLLAAGAPRRPAVVRPEVPAPVHPSGDARSDAQVHGGVPRAVPAGRAEPAGGE